MADTLEPISASASYFDVLGVTVSADESTLTRRFRELSRRYHPDRWANADSQTQDTALDATALLNDAYRTLKDPFARAEYLLRRERSVSLDDLQTTQKPPQQFLMQVLELQEALMEYQEARLDDDSATMDQLRPTLESAKEEFVAAYEGMAERLSDLFTRWDAQEDRTKVLDGIAEVVGTRGYLRRVLTNLNGTLG